MRIEITSPIENFLLRMTTDGLYTSHSDMVAKAEVGGKQYRFVHVAGSVALRKPRPGRARADMLRSTIQNAGLPPKTADDLYLELIRNDGAKGVRRTELLLKVRRVVSVIAFAVSRRSAPQ